MMRSNGLALQGSSKTTASHEYDADGATQKHEINDVRAQLAGAESCILAPRASIRSSAPCVLCSDRSKPNDVAPVR